MNNHIVVQFEPFILQQKIIVYVNGECVSYSYATIEKLVDTIEALKSEYNIKQIELYGYRDYLSRYQALMKTKFSNDDCNIEIIERK